MEKTKTTVSKFCAIRVDSDVYTIFKDDGFVHFGLSEEDFFGIVCVPEGIKPCSTDCTKYICYDLGIEGDVQINYYTFQNHNMRMSDHYISSEMKFNPVLVQDCDLYGNPISQPMMYVTGNGNGMRNELIGVSTGGPITVEELGERLGYHPNVDPNGIVRLRGVEEGLPDCHYSTFNYQRGAFIVPASFVPRKETK